MLDTLLRSLGNSEAIRKRTHHSGKLAGMTDLALEGRWQINELINGVWVPTRHSHNTITNVYRTKHMKWLAQSITPTNHIPPEYIAVGKGAAPADARTLTALQTELDRMLITTIPGEENAGTYEAKLTTVYNGGRGNGVWTELGFLDDDATTTTLDACDATTGWTSDGSLSLSTSNYCEGTGALAVSSTSALSGSLFNKTTISPTATSVDTTNGRLDFWYYVNDAALLSGTMTIEVSSSASVNTDEYEWTQAVSGLSTGWNFITKTFASATVNGSPNIDALIRFTVKGHTRNGSGGTPVVEGLDRVRLFQANGNLYCWSEINPSETKSAGQIKNVQWMIRIV